MGTVLSLDQIDLSELADLLDQRDDGRAQLRALDFLGAEQFEGEQLVADAELEAGRTEVVAEADALLDGLGRGQQGRLVLLNGLPGVGKSRLAREYVATRPGALNLDIDVLRTLLGGPWAETAELGRSLALSLIETHVGSGHEVVVPQLVADADELSRFEQAAEDGAFVMVLVEGRSRLGEEPWQTEVTPADLELYRQRLDLLGAQRPDARRLPVPEEGDASATLAHLEELLDADEPSASS